MIRGQLNCSGSTLNSQPATFDSLPSRACVDGDAVRVRPHESEESRWFAEQLQPYEPMLRAWLRSLFPSEGDIEDVVQEAYVRLLQLERADVASFVRAYLFRIAGNLAIDRLRRRATESRFQEPELFSDLFSRPPDPETLALEGERLEQIRSFLHELPACVREAFMLFRTEDMDQQSIARRLGITDRMVRNHISRALMYCRLRLEGASSADALLKLKAGSAS